MLNYFPLYVNNKQFSKNHWDRDSRYLYVVILWKIRPKTIPELPNPKAIGGLLYFKSPIKNPKLNVNPVMISTRFCNWFRLILYARSSIPFFLSYQDTYLAINMVWLINNPIPREIIWYLPNFYRVNLSFFLFARYQPIGVAIRPITEPTWKPFFAQCHTNSAPSGS